MSIGTFLFHMTLSQEGQFLDELPMMYLVLMSLRWAFDSPTRRVWLRPALWMYAATFSVVYALLPELFALFIVPFIVMSAMAMVQSWRILSAHREEAPESPAVPLIIFAISLYAMSFVVWVTSEHLLCPELRDFNVHACFHLMSALGPYCWLVAISYQWAWADGLRPSIVFSAPSYGKGGLWFLGLPYLELEGRAVQKPSPRSKSPLSGRTRSKILQGGPVAGRVSRAKYERSPSPVPRSRALMLAAGAML